MYVNLTPHAVSVFVTKTDTSPVATFAPSGKVARAIEVANGVVVREPEIGFPILPPVAFGAPTDLPDPKEGVSLIVSMVTANAALSSGRDCCDLFVPGEILRDSSGVIVGCVGLRRVV